MSDRADFLAGIAASGCGSPFGIHGDFGTFSGPYPDPSPPGGVFGISDYDMSDDYYPFSGEDYLDADSYTPKASETQRPSKPATKKKNKLAAPAKKPSKAEESSTKEKKPRTPMIHRHLNKDPSKVITPLSDDVKKILARTAREARAEFGESTEKKFKHVEWAVKTLPPASYTYYIHILGVDKEMQRQLRHLEREEDSIDEVTVKEEPVKTSGDEVSDSESENEPAEARKKLSSTAKRKLNRRKVDELTQMMVEKKHENIDARLSFYKWALTQLNIRWHRRFQKAVEKHGFLAFDGRTKYMQTEKGLKEKRKDLFSRPLSEVPFNKAERILVTGLLSLLMRISESVARRPWPKSSRLTKVLEEMKSEEHLLDALRKLVEKNWPYKPQGRAKYLTNKFLIDEVRKIDENLHGFPLLPSTMCIRRIILIVNAVYGMERRSPDDDHCAMPTDLAKEFEQSLYMKDVYDTWRATHPPDRERLKDFMMRGFT